MYWVLSYRTRVLGLSSEYRVQNAECIGQSTMHLFQVPARHIWVVKHWLITEQYPAFPGQLSSLCCKCLGPAVSEIWTSVLPNKTVMSYLIVCHSGVYWYTTYWPLSSYQQHIGFCGTESLTSLGCARIHKPSFCSGSCVEIHAGTKLQNKTSLIHSWNTLDTLFKIFLNTHDTLFKHPWTFLRMFWNYLETASKHNLNFF